METFEDDYLVRFFDRVVRRRVVGVLVRFRALDVGARWRRIALHVHFADRGVVVAVLHVLAVPVDQAAGPIDRALPVRGDTGGPKGKHDAGGCLRVEPAIRGGVPGVGTVEGAKDVAVDGPGEVVGRPVDGVGVLGGGGVGGGDVQFVCVWGDVSICVLGREIEERTYRLSRLGSKNWFAHAARPRRRIRSRFRP